MSGAAFIVGVGGSTRTGSSSERALGLALRAAEVAGARTEAFTGTALDLPMYAPEKPQRTAAAIRLVEALRHCDGLVISSPGYHGGVSGLIKNALDYIEDLREDERPYIDGVPVGCIVCASGWQATTTTLVATRSIVHALRGWPTPLGVCINTAESGLGDDGETGSRAAAQLNLLGRQVADAAKMLSAPPR